jgi:hypothetical protein
MIDATMIGGTAPAAPKTAPSVLLCINSGSPDGLASRRLVRVDCSLGDLNRHRGDFRDRQAGSSDSQPEQWSAFFAGLSKVGVSWTTPQGQIFGPAGLLDSYGPTEAMVVDFDIPTTELP